MIRARIILKFLLIGAYKTKTISKWLYGCYFYKALINRFLLPYKNVPFISYGKSPNYILTGIIDMRLQFGVICGTISLTI